MNTFKGPGHYLYFYPDADILNDKIIGWCLKVGQTHDAEERIKKYKTGNHLAEFTWWWPSPINQLQFREEKLISFVGDLFPSHPQFREHFILPGNVQDALNLLEENGIDEKIFTRIGKSSVNYKVKTTNVVTGHTSEIDFRDKRPPCHFIPGETAQVITEVGEDEKYRPMYFSCDMNSSGKITDLDEIKQVHVSRTFHNISRLIERDRLNRVKLKQKRKEKIDNGFLAILMDGHRVGDKVIDEF